MYISKLQGISEQNSTFRAKKIPHKNIEKMIDKLPQVGTVAMGTIGATIIVSANTGDIDPHELQKDLDNNMSWSQIAKKYGKSATSMRQFAAKHNLTTHDGKILQSVTKEDLLRWKEEGLSQKEVAEKLGLNHSGSLTPLLKIFGIEPFTAAKVNKITNDDWVEYKKQGLKDEEIAELLHVAPQYIKKQRDQLGYKAKDARELREYPVEGIREAVATKTLKEVENEFDLNHTELLRILNENNIEIPPQDEKAKFLRDKKDVLNTINQLSDESDLKYFIQNKAIKVSPENIEFITNIMNREDFQKRDRYLAYALKFLERFKKERPYDDAMKILNTFPEKNELGINDRDLAALIKATAEDRISADTIIDIYNMIINNDELREGFKNHPKYYGFDGVFSTFVTEKAAGTKENLEKILNDENLSKHATLLVFSEMNRKDYSKILDILSKQPELLENENVRNLIKNGFPELMPTSLFLTSIGIEGIEFGRNSDYSLDILNRSNKDDMNKLLKLYSKDNLDDLYPPRMEFLSVIPRLKNVFNNKVFISRLDEVLDNVYQSNRIGTFKILEKVNNSDAILGDDKKMHELLTLLQKTKSSPEKSVRVRRFLDDNL